MRAAGALDALQAAARALHDGRILAVKGVGGFHLACRVEQRDRRPAVRAGVRLRMEAPVARVLVLGLAGRAHAELRHRRERSVVGDTADDREPRAAVGAVDEGIAKPAIAGVEELPQASLAGRRIGRDRCVSDVAVRALADREAAGARRLELLGRDALDRRERWRVGSETIEEPGDVGVGPLDLQENAVGVVEHEAAEPELAGQPVDVRPKADALDRAVHAHPGAPAQAGRGAGAHPTSSLSAW